MTTEHIESTKHSFKLHDGLMKTIIRNQSGTFPRALAELIMNSIDAQAKTIDITITPTSFKVVDDGTGLGSEDEIKELFGKFGTPHEEGDAKYGRYRIGRAQIMNLAKVSWRSGLFEIRVDFGVEGTDFQYELLKTETPVNGCIVSGEMYKSLNVYDYNETVDKDRDTLSNLRYIKTALYLNGNRVNEDWSQIKWDFEDNYAYYRQSGDHFCNIYSDGIFVKSFHWHDFLFHGDVVTKSSLQLNMSRNEINANCDVFEGVKKRLELFKQEKFLEKRKLESYDRVQIREILFKRAFTSSTLKKLRSVKFLEDRNGKPVSPDQFFEGVLKGKIEEYSLYDFNHSSPIVADKAAEVRPILLIPFQNLAPYFKRHREVDSSNIKDAARILFKSFYPDSEWNPAFIQFDMLEYEYSGITKSIPLSKLTPKEKIGFAYACKINEFIAKEKRRSIHVGDSDTFDGWTDGSSKIWIHRGVLSSICTELNLSIYLVLLLAHEYCHIDDSSDNDHNHSAIFYKRYHDILKEETFGSMLSNAYSTLISVYAENDAIPGGEITKFIDFVQSTSKKIKRKGSILVDGEYQKRPKGSSIGYCGR